MNETILTIIGTGVAIIGFVYTFLRSFKTDVDLRLDKMINEIKEVNVKLNDVDKRLNDVDKRLYAVEIVLHMKDCCVLKQDQNLKKAD